MLQIRPFLFVLHSGFGISSVTIRQQARPASDTRDSLSGKISLKYPFNIHPSVTQKLTVQKRCQVSG